MPANDSTHLLRLSSLTSLERALPIGLVVVPKYALLLEAMLAAIATMPPGDAQKKLDDLLAGSPEAQQYISAVYYTPDTTPETVP